MSGSFVRSDFKCSVDSFDIKFLGVSTAEMLYGLKKLGIIKFLLFLIFYFFAKKNNNLDNQSIHIVCKSFGSSVNRNKKKNNKNKRAKVQKNIIKEDVKSVKNLQSKLVVLKSDLKKKQKVVVDKKISVKEKRLNPSRVRRNDKRAAKFSNPLSRILPDCYSITRDSSRLIFQMNKGPNNTLNYPQFKVYWFELTEASQNLFFKLLSGEDQDFLAWIDNFCPKSVVGVQLVICDIRHAFSKLELENLKVKYKV